MPLTEFLTSFDTAEAAGIRWLAHSDGKPFSDMRFEQRLVTHGPPDIVLAIGPEGGFTPDEIIGTKIIDAFIGESRHKVKELLKTILTQSKVAEDVIELIHNRKDGSQYPGEAHYKTLYGNDGEILGIQGITRDITDRKKLEDELQKMENLKLSVYSQGELPMT